MTSKFVLPPRPKRRPPRLKGDFLGFLKDPAKCEYSRDVLRFNASQKVFERKRVEHGYKKFRISLVKIERQQEKAYKSLLAAHADKKKISQEYAARRENAGLRLLQHPGAGKDDEEDESEDVPQITGDVPCLGDTKVESWLKQRLKDSKNSPSGSSKLDSVQDSLKSSKPVLPGIKRSPVDTVSEGKRKELVEDAGTAVNQPTPVHAEASHPTPRLNLHLNDIPGRGDDSPRLNSVNDKISKLGKHDLKSSVSPSAIKLVERKSKVLVVTKAAPNAPLVRQHSQELIELESKIDNNKNNITVQIPGPVVISDSTQPVVKPLKPVSISPDKMHRPSPSLPVISEQEENSDDGMDNSNNPIKYKHSVTNPADDAFNPAPNNASKEASLQDAIFEKSMKRRPSCRSVETVLAPLEKTYKFKDPFYSQLAPGSGRLSKSLDTGSKSGSTNSKSKNRLSLAELNVIRRKEEAENRKQILDAEDVTVYVRDEDGFYVPSGLPFKRCQFLTPSNRGDRIRKGLLEAQREADKQQTLKMNQFMDQVAHDLAIQKVWEYRPPPLPEPPKSPVKSPELGQTLIQYMTAFRQNLDVEEGQDVNSYDVIAKNCRYVRRYRSDDPHKDTELNLGSIMARSS